MKLMKKLLLAGLAVSTLLAGATAVAAPHYNVNDYYEVEVEGRLYIFDDLKTYRSFLEVGETAYRLTRIGAGPKGETVVFGLRKQDKKMRSGLGGVDLFDGKAEGMKVGFYGEIYTGGRTYVFSEWTDLASFKSVGEAPYRFTDIGAGPRGETVVYVLNKKNKKRHPTALINAFKKVHQM